jgi:hypothetical protein
MVYRENIGQFKHLPFYDFRNYRHIQMPPPPPPIQLEFGGTDAVFTSADVKTQLVSITKTYTVGGMLA